MKIHRKHFNIIRVIRNIFHTLVYREYQRSLGFDPPLSPTIRTPSIKNIIIHEWRQERASVYSHNKLADLVAEGKASKDETVAYCIGTEEGRKKLAKVMIEPIRVKGQ